MARENQNQPKLPQTRSYTAWPCHASDTRKAGNLEGDVAKSPFPHFLSQVLKVSKAGVLWQLALSSLPHILPLDGRGEESPQCDMYTGKGNLELLRAQLGLSRDGVALQNQ